jgi:DNA replication and repair protein RecF
MYLKTLHLLNFKNWEQAEFDFNAKINCLVGNNGSGKTNVLDAIHYLSVCKSYFNSVDSQNIRNDEGFFVVEGDLKKLDSDYHLYCGLKRGQKKVFKKNKKEYARLSEHIGQFPSVIISPYDRDLITEGSEVRRKFMDGVIAQSDPIYLDNLIRYNKALQQRNSLLKFFAANHSFDAENLDIYNEQLDAKGQPIFEIRKEFIESLKIKLQHYYQLISGGNEEINLNYKTQLGEQRLKDVLLQNLQKDRLNQYTGFGIHKDDLEFSLNGRSLKKFGSQGQQKSFLIALKLAQYDFISEKLGVNPVLLLDDIFDKLDEQRVEQLIKLVNEDSFGQIFITDTHPERTEAMIQKVTLESRIFQVNQGQVQYETE